VTYAAEFSDVLKYIDSFWEKATIRPKKRERLLNLILKKSRERMRKNIINMPHSFIIPNTRVEAQNETNPGWSAHVFYWDTFFIFRGLIRTRHEWLLKSMVENFMYLYGQYGIIPNFSSPASTGRSQPPFLSSMILDTYNGYYFAYRGANPFKKAVINLDKYKKWLKVATKTALDEYNNVWMDPKGLFRHRVKGFELNRYGDRDVGYAHSSELESGWDFTSRFYNRCDEFLPIDLNVLLYKYERDFSKIAAILGNEEDRIKWKEVAALRREQINKYMWNDKRGFFYDYGYRYKAKSTFLSLAGFTPLWAGLATSEQAARMVKMLPKFESKFGLIIGTADSLAPKVDLSKIPIRYRHAVTNILKPKQWDYPNIWPPLEYLTVIGLLKYGFVDDAVRIMKKSLIAQSKIFRKYGTFFEKINGETGDKSGNYHYTNQSGFGWTNAIFARYLEIIDAIETGNNIYSDPKSVDPPFKLSIPH